MNVNASRTVLFGGWAWGVVLGLGAFSASAQASPISFSTSGRFELPAGPVDLVGRTDAAADNDFLSLGTISAAGNPGSLGETPFRLTFAFDGLPSIDVGGTVGWLGYNPDMPVLATTVATTATPDQVGLYPEIFQRLLAHPDWMHTTSFRGNLTEFDIAFSVHPEDPGATRPVPEPSAILIVAAAFAGTAWKARRRLSGAVALEESVA